ncbi:TPA: hypothetical protein QDC03_007098, partial [Burkholderia cepacia]|nr:hypothetical protein [Burkholderia cepacia]
MNARQKTFLSMSAVARIRVERKQKELTRLLPELRNATDEISAMQRRLEALETSRRGWLEVREVREESKRLICNSELMCARLEWIDHQISDIAEALRMLEDQAEALREQCRFQERLISKHNELEKTFRLKGKMIGKLTREAQDEEDADDSWTGKRQCH